MQTGYPGATPDDVEDLITRPIEDAVSGLANVDFITSSSLEGRSQVVITFTDAADVNLAATDVERRISAIRGQLPADASSPTVLKFDLAQIPVLTLAYSGTLGQEELFRIADNTIKPRLETRDGVGSVTITGGLEREIQVRVNPTRLRAYNLTLDQVSAALGRENQAQPVGTLDQGGSQTSLRLYGLVQSIQELEDLTVAAGANSVVRLGDVAEVADTNRRVTSRSFLNGQEAVVLTITKQSDANEITTVDALRREIALLGPTLPAGSELLVINDSSQQTRNSLQGVERALLEALGLTALVLLVFLHSLRSTVIVLFAIPTALISTFVVMSVLGFTLNIMSSLALVLVIGVLVDDSIVVLENISRHLEMGETAWTAALKGRSEIGLAAIAITLVDVVVFTPVAFLSGTVGSFFQQFGIVIASATLLSLFVSFTLTPMLASRWLSGGHQALPSFLPFRLFVRGFEAFFDRLRNGYSGVLGWSLRHRWVPLVVAFASVAAAVAMVPLGLVKFEFIPQTDNGRFLVSVELAPGSSLQATELALRAAEQQLAAVPEVEYYISTSGSGGSARNASIQVVLVERDHRQRSVNDVIAQLSAQAQAIPGATVRIQAAGGGGGGGGQPVQVRITGDDPARLQQLAARVEALLRATPGTRNVDNSASLGNPETRLVPDRRRMANLGITVQQQAGVLRTAVEGTVVTTLRAEGADEVDVRLIADEATRQSLESLGGLPLSGSQGGQPVTVSLNQVTRTEQVTAPASIDRRNRQRLVTVGADLAGVALGDVTQPLQLAITQLQAEGAIPPGYAVVLGGQAEGQADAFGNLLLALALSIALEYMLLAALYESVILPFATMFALPVSVVGAFGGLAISGNTLNLLSLIGVIVLMGLVGKNGILLVDYTNTLRQRGFSRADALKQAGPTRLRPIVMTTLALVFGMMPLALQLEEGGELYAGMACVIIGGMISSTLLSLIVVPCMYTYFDDLQTLIGRIWRWRPFRARRRLAPAAPSAAVSLSKAEG